MRLLADTNITAQAVAALRDAGHDVIYSAERAEDPGDRELLAEAHVEGRVLVTKDHDFGDLIFREGLAHAGVLLIDDLGDASEESALLLQTLADHHKRLAEKAFLRATSNGVRPA